MVSWRRVAIVGGAGLVALLSCDRDKDATPGEVMVEVTSDLQVPQDLSSIQIVVSANGVTQLDQTSALGPDDLQLPATFGVIAGANVAPSTPAKIDVIGYRTSASGAPLPQIVNEAVVTIPESGIVLLRMPLDYLCLNQLKANPAASDAGSRGDGGGSSAAPYVPSCPAGETCLAGACVPETVTSGSLPAFAPDEVTSGQYSAAADTGACFNVATCFARAVAVMPGGAPCSFAVPSGLAAGDLNVAIETSTTSAGEGTCLSDGACLVPLDEGPGGWTLSGETVDLPVAVCATRAKVVVSGACGSKASATPLCTGAAGTLPDAGHAARSDAGDATVRPHDGGKGDARHDGTMGMKRSDAAGNSGSSTATSTGTSTATIVSSTPSTSSETSSSTPATNSTPESSSTSTPPFDAGQDASSSSTSTPPFDAGQDASSSSTFTSATLPDSGESSSTFSSATLPDSGESSSTFTSATLPDSGESSSSSISTPSLDSGMSSSSMGTCATGLPPPAGAGDLPMCP